MAAPQYNAASYKQAKEAARPNVNAGLAYCTEIICVMPTRWIPPGTRWVICHDHRDPTGHALLGPGHARCNESENARRNNPKRAQKTRRWSL